MLSMKVFPPNAYHMYLLFIFRLIFIFALLLLFMVVLTIHTNCLIPGRFY